MESGSNLASCPGKSVEHYELLYDLFDRTLKSFEFEYKERVDRWRDLERKANITTAISGILFGVIISLLSQKGIVGKDYFLFTLIFILMFILITFSYAVSVLHLQTVREPPKGADIRKFVPSDLKPIKKRAERLEVASYFMSDLMKVWEEVNFSLEQGNRSKAVALRKAQWALFVAVLLTVFIATRCVIILFA